MLASIPGISEPTYLQALKFGVTSQAMPILAWVATTFSTIWSGPHLLSPLVALPGAAEFRGT